MPSNGATIFMRDSCACGQRHLRLGHLQRRDALVDRALADEVLRHQLPVALQVGAGDAGLRPAACCSCACCSVSSSCTSNWPRCTRWPSVKSSCAMRPLTSGRSITPLPRAQRADRLGVVLERRRLDPGDLDHGTGPPAPLRRPAAAAARGRPARRPRWPRRLRGRAAHRLLPPPGSAAGQRRDADQRQRQVCRFHQGHRVLDNGALVARIGSDCGAARDQRAGAPARRGWPAHRRARCRGRRRGP